jgi:hypothetical protein
MRVTPVVFAKAGSASGAIQPSMTHKGGREAEPVTASPAAAKAAVGAWEEQL